ncbi:MAG: serine/threonine protein kinase [Polyangiaceae bacterium]
MLSTASLRDFPRRAAWPLVVAFLLLGASACGHQFAIQTPSGFVEIDNEFDAYDYRATTTDGLIIAVREIENEVNGEAAFWLKAIENQMRRRGGYALLGSEDVKSGDGLAGKQMRFGHDQDGKKPHLYYVYVFVSDDNVVLLEVGGTKKLVTEGEKEIANALAGFRVKGS